MMPVIPCSTSNFFLIPGAAFTTKKNSSLRSGCLLRKTGKHSISSQKLVLPLPTSVLLLKCSRHSALLHRSVVHIVAATGSDVAVEETDSQLAGEVSAGALESSTDAIEAVKSSAESDASPPAQSIQSRSSRKSEMPPVKNEDLVPGATFIGKVVSIQPFGAFVDFGAFTNGLVHVSRLSDEFVQDVADVVSVGEEVEVTVIEANTETGRISLTMRDTDDISNLQQQKDPPATATGDKQKPDEGTSSKFSVGQELEGTIKNITNSGAFVSLPGDEEGFVPTPEGSAGGLRKKLEIGQEVSVQVTRVVGQQVTLTIITFGADQDNSGEDEEYFSPSHHVGTNAFVQAFRKHIEIASFLDEREKAATIAQEQTNAVKIEEQVTQTETVSDIAEVKEQAASSVEGPLAVPASVDKKVDNDETFLKEDTVGANVTNDKVEPERIEAELSPSKNDLQTETQNAANDLSSAAPVEDEAVGSSPEENGNITDGVKNLENLEASGEPNDVQPLSLESQVNEEVTEKQVDTAKDEVKIETSSVDTTSASEIQDGKVESAPAENGNIGDSQGQNVTISPALVKQLREETGAGMMDCKKALSETGGDIVKAQEFLRKKGLASAEKKASRATSEGRIGSYIHDSRIGVLVEVNCETDFVSRGEIFKELVDDIAMQVAACPQVQYLGTEDIPEDLVNKEKEIEMQKEDLSSKPEQIRSKIVEGRIRKRLEELALLEQPYIKNDKLVVKDWVKQTIATIGENIKVKRFVRYNLGEGLEKKSHDFAAEVAAQTAAKSPVSPAKEQSPEAEAKETAPKPPAVTVSPALVKQLREETGAGMMDCKKALAETGGDLGKAQEYLRKKGLSAADKKSSRLAAEGRIGSYIHDSRIGVMIEVNCETDFVGRSEKFKELVDDLAMQVAACPQVQFVSIEDIGESIMQKEKEIEMQREDLQSKPENIREKIVEGRVSKRLGELALLEQPFIRDDSLLVKDLVKQTVAALGENIKVRRFVRFTLGEVAGDA